MADLPSTALVGAGYIADVHAQAVLATGSARLAAVVDPVAARAERLARNYRIPTVLRSVEDLIESRSVTAAHVLVPPPLHRAVAEPLLRSGIHVLLEKPAATSAADCAALLAAAEAGGARLRVNHNYLHHPAYERLKTAVARNAVGAVRHVSCIFHMPLRQLAAGQLGHWMFQSPLNLLLEQAVHPLSLIDDLIGPIEHLSAVQAPARASRDGIELITGWLVDLYGARGTAQLAFSLGETYPVWTITVLGSDGRLDADLVRNQQVAELPTAWLDPVNDAIVACRTGMARCRDGLGGALAYARSVTGLAGRSDAFFQTMQGGVAAFYAGLQDRSPEPCAERLVSLCESIVQTAAAPTPAFARPRRAQAGAVDVLVLGGTGFIGTALVRELVREGQRVGVVARSDAGLPKLFEDPKITFFNGSVTDPTLLDAVLPHAPVVVHLAHGGGGTWPEIEAQMVGGARLVAERALGYGTRHLVFASSIAALYLGDPATVVTAATPADPCPEQRGDYARGKIACEALLLELAARRELPVTIIRPGVVVGAGSSPFHSALGVFNRESHCVGWNAGRNPLPFVLVDDVASAIRTLLASNRRPGGTYNLVGDVRLSARDYLAEVGRRLNRPLRFLPQAPTALFLAESGKWGIKRAGGRREASFVTLRDLRSRGLVASFDTSREVEELGWHPESRQDRFLERALAGLGSLRS